MQTLQLAFAEAASSGIELFAVLLLVVAIAISTLRFADAFVLRRERDTAYTAYRHAIARALLLCLEILVAADVIRTLSLAPTIESVGSLGMLVVIRTFLSWSLVVEIEGRWPWQRGAPRP